MRQKEVDGYLKQGREKTYLVQVKDPLTGKPMVDPATGEPVKKTTGVFRVSVGDGLSLAVRNGAGTWECQMRSPRGERGRGRKRISQVLGAASKLKAADAEKLAEEWRTAVRKGERWVAPSLSAPRPARSTAISTRSGAPATSVLPPGDEWPRERPAGEGRLFWDAVEDYLRTLKNLKRDPRNPDLPPKTLRQHVSRFRYVRDLAPVPVTGVSRVSRKMLYGELTKAREDFPDGLLVGTVDSTGRKLARALCSVFVNEKVNHDFEGDAPISEEILRAWLKGTVVPQGQSHAAMPFDNAPKFYRQLDEIAGRLDMRRERITSVKARIVQAIILTGCRAKEVIGADWSEVDTEAMVWTIPKSRTKSSRVHYVFLTPELLRVFGDRPETGTGPVFVDGHGEGLRYEVVNDFFRPLVEEMKSDTPNEPPTLHGFRTTLASRGQSWKYDIAAVNLCIAHKIKGRTDQAYLRYTFEAERKELMQRWSPRRLATVDRYGVVTRASSTRGMRSRFIGKAPSGFHVESVDAQQ